MLKNRYDDPGLIIQKHVRALFEQPAITKENHIALRMLLDNVLKHLRALKALKRPVDRWDDLMIHMITSRLDHTTSKEWETTIRRGEIPSLDQLSFSHNDVGLLKRRRGIKRHPIRIKKNLDMARVLQRTSPQRAARAAIARKEIMRYINA